jgi:hypothetical protein
MDSVKGLTTWHQTTIAKRKSWRESILASRSNKGIHVRLQDNHGIHAYLMVQTWAHKEKNLIGDDAKRSFRVTRVLL